MSDLVHPTAIVDPSAELAAGVEVGPYAIIEGEVSIGSGCRIAAHAIIRRFSELEENVTVDSFAVIGGLPQDLSFSESTKSGVFIGQGTVVREAVTIHRATEPDSRTQVGRNCLLMSNSHIAHDCRLGDHVVLVNNVMLAGHVHVGDKAVLGGGCGIHQFVNIGKMVMVAGNASVTYDVPSYVMAAERSTVTGLNLVGLKRNLSREAVSDLRSCYKSVYMRAGDPVKLAREAEAQTDEGREFLGCFGASRRGRFCRSKIQTQVKR